MGLTKSRWGFFNKAYLDLSSNESISLTRPWFLFINTKGHRNVSGVLATFSLILY